MADDSGKRDDEKSKVLRFPDPAPARHKVTLRLDPDALAKFRPDEPGWQDRINRVLRERLQADDDVDEPKKVKSHCALITIV